MRFTPTAIFGSSVGSSLQAIATGAQSGSFISGGINYGFLEFQYTTGSSTLTVATGANVDILLVGSGAGAAGQTGGGGGGVNVISTRLLRGFYTISVGAGGARRGNGNPTSLTGYNINYIAGGGEGGVSGLPTSNTFGASSGNCGGGNTAGGGGGGASQTGSSAFCPPSNVPNGAAGGEGLTYNFDGTASVYGSGGGGGGDNSAFAGGGPGGTNAGNGASYNAAGTSAINGFGGGGGGERAGNFPSSGGTGGHGTIIIRYTIQ
jgi:hypothetical protein